MNYFNMTYDEVVKSPMQRLIMLSKGIPKYESKEDKEKNKESKFNILDFAMQYKNE